MSRRPRLVLYNTNKFIRFEVKGYSGVWSYLYDNPGSILNVRDPTSAMIWFCFLSSDEDNRKKIKNFPKFSSNIIFSKNNINNFVEKSLNKYVKLYKKENGNKSIFFMLEKNPVFIRFIKQPTNKESFIAFSNASIYLKKQILNNPLEWNMSNFFKKNYHFKILNNIGMLDD